MAIQIQSLTERKLIKVKIRQGGSLVYMLELKSNNTEEKRYGDQGDKEGRVCPEVRR
jgi:hypothetical protein